MFAQRRNRLMTHFSERIPVVKPLVSVLNWRGGGSPFLLSFFFSFFFNFILRTWTFGLEITGRISTGRTLCVRDCSLRISTCHW